MFWDKSWAKAVPMIFDGFVAKTFRTGLGGNVAIIHVVRPFDFRFVGFKSFLFSIKRLLIA